MGICRARRFKHRLTGGRMPIHQKKKKHEMGRPPSHTRLGANRVRPVRVRGGSKKYRALRLDNGGFSWASEGITRKTRIVAVVYNATSNELVRTNTLTKNTVVQIDATPFKQWSPQTFSKRDTPSTC
uniref:40S ribosomal protein S8 n=1 Tax=Lankesteria abbotti TaxID=340204 RepID=A0A7S2VTU2_9APIC|mmetsp:Transcript_1600/g.1905  ORF Transcript_1600/g.1905 Transcript_1600/m.1905 type:complete len:127 (+) Transcript_1600:76-456(+)